MGLGTPETCLLCGCARRLPAFHTPAPAPPCPPSRSSSLEALAPPLWGQLLPSGVSSWPAQHLPLLTITTSLTIASRTPGLPHPAVTRTIHINPTLSNGWLLTPLLHSPWNCHLTPGRWALLPSPGTRQPRGHQASWVELLCLGTSSRGEAPTPRGKPREENQDFASQTPQC